MGKAERRREHAHLDKGELGRPDWVEKTASNTSERATVVYMAKYALQLEVENAHLKDLLHASQRLSESYAREVHVLAELGKSCEP